METIQNGGGGGGERARNVMGHRSFGDLRIQGLGLLMVVGALAFLSWHLLQKHRAPLEYSLPLCPSFRLGVAISYKKGSTYRLLRKGLRMQEKS